MKPAAGAIGKSVVLISVGVFIILFLAELMSVPTSGNLFEKLILIRPIIFALRVSLIFVAAGIIGLVISVFWKQISIIKIGASGVEFGKLDETSDKTQRDIAARDAKIKELEEINEAVRKERDELREFSERLIAMRGDINHEG